VLNSRPWGFWLTVVFSLCVVGAYILAQVVALLVVGGVKGVLHDPKATYELGMNGLVASLGICAGTPLVLALCGLFIWLRQGLSCAVYLGLTCVTWRVVVASFGAIVLFNLAVGGLGILLDRPDVPESMLEIYRTAGFPPLLWLAVIVGAPLTEEILFRGFLFRGIEHTRAGGLGAVVLSSLAWAAIHLQYEAYEMGVIFSMGLVLGAFRWKTGSLLPALFMHVLNNLAATIQVTLILSQTTSVSALL
jgi:membrane protease YdiL (CAAX protease family)